MILLMAALEQTAYVLHLTVNWFCIVVQIDLSDILLMEMFQECVDMAPAS